MSDRRSIKRRLFLLLATVPLIVRKWSIQKKLYVSLLSLIVILGLNAAFTSYEVQRLKEHDLKIGYLVYLDILGILSGCLFIWVLSKSVIRPMKKMVEQIEKRSFVEPLNAYSADEIGDLARAVSLMKRSHFTRGENLEEKNHLIEAILDHSIDSIFMFNSKGKILSYSRSFKESFGYQGEELGDAELQEMIPSLQLQEIVQKFSGSSPQKHFYTKELSAQRQNKKMFKIECSICPVQGKKENTYVGIIRNMKKKKRLKAFFAKFKPPRFLDKSNSNRSL